jgi:hypothetical protein
MCSGLSVNRRHGSPNRPGNEKAALWQTRFLLTTERVRRSGPGQAGKIGSKRPQTDHFRSFSL